MARKKDGGAKKGNGKGRAGARRNKQRSGAGSSQLVDHKLMKALSKPIRAEILAVLAERVASPTEMATELDDDLSTVSYHVRVLLECGVIELDRSEQRRGAVEHFYRCPNRTLIPPETWDDLPPKLKAQVSLRILQEFHEDARKSMKAGVFDDPAGELAWTPLILDERGMEELGRLAGGFLEALLDIQRDAVTRLPEDGSGSLSATAFLACFRSARGLEEGKRASATKRR